MFAISFPNQDALATIYSSILSQHLALAGFAGPVQKFTSSLIQGALALHSKMATTFLPTAIKFHYVFNLRDLSNIFQVQDALYDLLFAAGCVGRRGGRGRDRGYGVIRTCM